MNKNPNIADNAHLLYSHIKYIINEEVLYCDFNNKSIFSIYEMK